MTIEMRVAMIDNRIALLESRAGRENAAVIRKLKRKRRALIEK